MKEYNHPMRRLIPLLCALLLSSCVVPSQTIQDMNAPPVTLPAGTFRIDEGSGRAQGTTYVRGYTRIIAKEEPFCEKNCLRYQYVFLRLLSSGSGALDTFLAQNEGNAYAGEKSIGLGCVTQSGAIAYINDSDANGRVSATLPADLSEQILRSTKIRPVTLALTKLPLSGGMDAPVCYAHFSRVKIYTPEEDTGQENIQP